MEAVGALPTGSGSLDLGAYLLPDRFGGALEYRHHLRDGLSAYGRGWLESITDHDPQFGAAAGLRWSW